MSVHDALAFIKSVAEETKLQKKIRSLGDEACLADITTIGDEVGFKFSEEELRTAFAKDWDARSSFYSYYNKS